MAAPRPSRAGLRVAVWPADRPEAVNPYPSLLARALRDAGAQVDELEWGRLVREPYDIVHVHWPEWVLDSESWRRRARMLGALAVARRRGAALFWTVHNLGAHDRGDPNGRSWQRFVGSVDGVISMTEAAVPSIQRTFPGLAGTPTFVIPHGHYREVYPAAPTRAEARATLGITQSRVLLTFGHVRPYKGIPRLLDAFARWGEGDASDSALVVAGEPADALLAEEIRRRASTDTRVQLRLEAIPSSEVPNYFAAADLVVLPYREILNSGAALLALSFGRPVLAPTIGTFPELELKLGGRWVRTYSGPLDPSVLEAALNALDRPAETEAPDLTSYAWPHIAQETIAAYQRVRRQQVRDRA